MARMKIKWHVEGFRELMKSADGLIEEKAAAVTDACNAESSWGGYEYEMGDSDIRARARVWSYGPGVDRANRMIRNLG